MAKLTTQAVTDLLAHCLYTDAEADNGEVEETLIIEGILHDYGLHPGRVDENRENIAELLRELPDNFFIGGGGGWTFLNLCMDKHGNHWSEHPTMEVLCVLAIAAGLGKWVGPKKMWRMFPGGMPYIQFDLRSLEAA
jgi:hypothetical protein